MSDEINECTVAVALMIQALTLLDSPETAPAARHLNQAIAAIVEPEKQRLSHTEDEPKSDAS